MLDRLGLPIAVGWPPHHIIYLQAALALPRSEHTAAFQDIADLTGRSLNAVQSKAYALQRQRLRIAPGCELRQPSKIELMGAK